MALGEMQGKIVPEYQVSCVVLADGLLVQARTCSVTESWFVSLFIMFLSADISHNP